MARKSEKLSRKETVTTKVVTGLQNNEMQQIVACLEIEENWALK